MSENNIFPDKEQDLKQLSQDISELKLTMKDIGNKLTQIERHVHRSFYVTRKDTSKDKKSSENLKTPIEDNPTINGEQAILLFDELANAYLDGQSFLENKMIGISTPNLKLIAHEIGITFRTKPSRKIIELNIKKRINERILLSKNSNRNDSKNQK
jgi:hypothetical protein